MSFLISAQDTAGNVTLNRESVPAALKKAAELISDGCWDVEIVTPDAIHIVDQTPEHTATLFACHPPGSTRERIVVHLVLADA